MEINALDAMRRTELKKDALKIKSHFLLRTKKWLND
jgi:hypothetical protein